MHDIQNYTETETSSDRGRQETGHSPLCHLSPVLCALQLSLQHHQFAGNLTQRTAMEQAASQCIRICIHGDWRELTSSYLRSASSAMCLASLSCTSWISIFSSSFNARFSITFIPLHREAHR